MTRSTLLLIAGVNFLGIAGFGEPDCTAVLVDETLRDEPFGDLLTVELSDRGVPLVERGDMALLASEVKLKAFGGEDAIQVGRLLGARLLLLLDRPLPDGGGPAARLRVVDVATGLRLGKILHETELLRPVKHKTTRFLRSSSRCCR
jgi:hypothetical protein